MKSRWKSFFYVPVLAVLLAAGGSFIWGFHSVTQSPSREQVYDLDEYFEADISKPAQVHTVDDKNVLLEKHGTDKALSEQTEEQTEAPAEFILRMADGHVMVYRSGNMEEIFMSTGILIEELPTETKKEILAGKTIADEQELYFFLESYSS